MDVYQIIIIIFCCVLLWLIIRFVTKLLFKILLLILIILIGFLGYFHFSKQNIFDTMNELYCVQKKSSEDLTCKCFVENIIDSFNIRNGSLTKHEKDSIKKNTIQSMRQFIESYESRKEDIRDCFEENGVSGGMAEEIKNDIIKKTTGIFNLKK